MELDWSAQSPHIRSLFHPWQPGDGYDEETVQAAEARLGVRLPATLRNFYKAWGRRREITRLHNLLLFPDTLKIRGETLIFWIEHQSSQYWGIQREALKEDHPPVVVKNFAVVGWRDESELPWTPSHAHLSSFLDDMTYLHAFCGGAIHGGYTEPYLPFLPEHHIAWLEENWSKATVSSLTFQLMPDPTFVYPTLYVRDGQAFWSLGGCSLAAREAKVVDEIAQRFQINWAHRWLNLVRGIKRVFHVKHFLAQHPVSRETERRYEKATKGIP